MEEQIKEESAEELKTENIPSENNTDGGIDSTSIENNEELIKTQVELADMKDKYLRLYSEFDNFRKRTAKEKIDTIKTASESLIVELLPIIDDFERAQKSIDSDSNLEKIKEGVVLIHHKFLKTLEKKGMQKIEVSKGQSFDPEYHEAITQFPAEEELKGKIVDIVEAGYKLHDKVIRFAKVVTGA